MRTVIDTIYFKDILLNKALGSNYIPMPGTTINEQLNISVDATDGSTSIKYYTVGLTTIETLADIDSIEHSPVDTVLYEQIPLYIVDSTTGLSAYDRTQYGLIKNIVKDGVNYDACYAKRIDAIPTNTSVYDVNFDAITDLYEITPFSNANDRLGKPTPKIGKDYIFSPDAPSVAVSAVLTIVMSLEDVGRLSHVIEKLYYDSDLITDRIFEIGVVANNKDNGFFVHTHYLKINALLDTLTETSNQVYRLDLGSMIPVNV